MFVTSQARTAERIWMKAHYLSQNFRVPWERGRSRGQQLVQYKRFCWRFR